MSTPNIENIYRLTPLQTGMLYHSLGDGGDVRPYAVQMVEELTGPLDIARYRDAWQKVVDRHAVLRTAFVWEGVSTPVQVVQRRAVLPYAFHDWRDLPAEAREERFDALAAADWERGFDLAAAPLLRVTVVRTAEDVHRVLWSFHHILLDGWSVQLVLRDLFAYYRDGSAAAPEPAVPFVRHAEWLEAQSRDGARDFWTGYLRGITAPTPVPVRRDTGRTGVGAVEWDFDEDFSATVREAARAHRVTVNTLVQGAWSLLLSHYSRENAVVFGSTVSGRPPALRGVESMVGLFINTLPVRVDLEPDATLAAWLRGLQEQQAELRQYEYSSLVDVHGWSEVTRGEPLFDTILVFENYPSTGRSGPPEELTRRLLHCEERTGYPLTVVAWSGRTVGAKLVYDEGAFDAADVERMAGHLRTLLTGMATAGAETRLADLEMLTPGERAEIVCGWNDNAAGYPDAATIHGLIGDRVRECPDAVAVRHGDVSVTYMELEERANRLARHLRDLGAGPGTLVGICLERGIDAVTALLGVLKAGAAFVPLDPEYPAARLEFMLADTAAPIVITGGTAADHVPDTSAVVVDLDRDRSVILAGESVALDPIAGPDDLAYVIYTSGSTGKPKGVMLDHRGVVNYLAWCDANYPPSAEIGTYLYSSITFDLTITALFLPLMQGLTIAVPATDGETTAFQATAADLLGGTEVSFLKATPSHLEVLVSMAEESGASLGIHSIVAGGEELTAALARRLFAASSVPVTIVNEYGATEGSVANVMSLTREVPDDAVGGVNVGRAVQNTAMYIVDQYGQPVPVGVPGEALLGGICVARGYLNREELTAQRFVADPFSETPGARMYHTGDLVKWLPDGTGHFLGRIDNQVKLRGYRIELGEIEAAILTHPGVTAATVIVREDTPGDKRLTAYLTGDTDTTVLREALRVSLPDYMVPVSYITLDTLPLTVNGKVDVKALPAPEAGAADAVAAYVPPSTSTERTIAEVWAAVLGVERVGAGHDFFQLGGHSITAITVAARLKAAGLPAGVRQVMRHPVLRDLARALDGDASDTASLVVPLTTGGEDLPALFCVHPGGGSVHGYATLAKPLAGRYRVYGVQAAGLDGTEPPVEGVPGMAARYWREIEAVQPEGPYHLLGWSTGGVVVHEMGVQRPEAVASVVILEPAVTGPAERARFDRHARVRERAETLWTDGQDASGDHRAAVETELRALAAETGIDPDAVTLDVWLPFPVLAAELRALADYEPGVSTAPATLVIGIDQRGDETYTAHWRGRYADGPRIVDVDATHLRLVRDEKAVARVVREVGGGILAAV